jgi:membrane-associated phospholipid phosphatase
VATTGSPTHADSFHHREAKFATSPGLGLFIAAGLGSSLLQDGEEGKNHALRTLDAVATSGLLAEAFKRTVRERRPGSPDERDSFPSGHATLSFAVATMQSHYHPKQAPLWYLGAAAISESRVELNRHRWRDVIGGAALGYFTARYELKQHRGLLLSPLIRPDEDGTRVGFQISSQF